MVEDVEQSGARVLCEAVASKDFDLVRKLVDEGISVNAFAAEVESLHGYDWTALHTVAATGDVEIAKFLLQNGADVNAARAEMITPLIVAAQDGRKEIIDVFIENGADVNRRDRYGRSALHYAAKKGILEIVKALVHAGCRIHARDEKERIPLSFAEEKGHDSNKALKDLLTGRGGSQVHNHQDVAPLCQAAADGELEEIKNLLEEGLPINGFAEWLDTLGVYDWTPLHAAAAFGHIECIQFLVKFGADVNAARAESRSPLFLAARYGHVNAVKLLIELGADVNHVNIYNRNALHSAASNGFLDVVKVLVKAGASKTLEDIDGKTPRDMAFDYGNNSKAMLSQLKPKRQSSFAIFAGNIATLTRSTISKT